MAVDWLAGGRLDVSRALADARFSTGLDRSISQRVPEINVRWVPGLDADRRRVLEESFGLEPRNEVAPTTWSYVLSDVSRENMAIAIVQHPDVEDTHGIDRAEALLVEWYQGSEPGAGAETVYAGSLTFTGVAARRSAPRRHRPCVRQHGHRPGGHESRRVAAHDVGDTSVSRATGRTAARTRPSRRGWRRTRILISA